ncbi:MAG: hypothetical protein KJP07_19575, partial [Desulfatitalea sp.]|nr:hypothetical protein [Desulfatitalea sp.]
IEGSEAAIRKAAEVLGLDWKHRILMNYLALFEVVKKAAGLPFEQVTFDLFRNHPATIRPYLDECRGTG